MASIAVDVDRYTTAQDILTCIVQHLKVDPRHMSLCTKVSSLLNSCLWRCLCCFFAQLAAPGLTVGVCFEC